jgi:hypothetical protein
MRNLTGKGERIAIKPPGIIWEIISKMGEQGKWKKVNNEEGRKEGRNTED